MVLVRRSKHNDDVDCEEHIHELVNYRNQNDLVHRVWHSELNWNHERVVNREDDDEKVPSDFETFIWGEPKVKNPLPPSHVLVDLHF